MPSLTLRVTISIIMPLISHLLTSMNNTVLAVVFFVTLIATAVELNADEPPDTESQPKGYPNVAGFTLGGKQFWADELLYADWRIQRHVYTHHYRLLDGNNYRHAAGDFEHCRKRLEKIKVERELPPMSGKAVVLLHGLMRSRASMSGLGNYLRENGDYVVLNVGYPSTRGDLAAHAASLASVIEHLDGIDEINFVAHSMGNVVLRRYLADQTDETTGRRPDPRIQRIVMLGPPNNGSQFAAHFKNNSIFKVVWGKSAKELAADWDEIEKHLATPQCEFGIIAGGLGDAGRNPMLEGNDDFVVTVDETRLAGARDFTVVPVMHSVLMNDESVRSQTLTFLQHGFFVSEEQRQPIEQ